MSSKKSRRTMDKSENASVLSRLGDPTFHAIL